VGADLTDLFNVLTGYSRQTAYRRLLVAPHGVRSGLIERIDREIEHVRAGRPGLVQIKANSLVDEELVDALYRASRAGVDVDLVIRGICTLKPGVPGLSERIRVRSIVGRFLEHSRVFRFGDGVVSQSGDPTASIGPTANPGGEFWIGSADLMHRNLDRRVEALVQVTDPTARVELDRMMRLAMDERTAAFELSGDGTWHRRAADGDQPLVDLQEALLRRVVDKVE
jgi:polyphosphate kinase